MQGGARSNRASVPSFATWLLPVAAVLALAIAIFEYFWTGNGIHGTPGALLVVISSAALLLFAAWLAFGRRRLGGCAWCCTRASSSTSRALHLPRTCCTQWWLVGAMALALIGWIASHRARSVQQRGRPAPAVIAGALVAAAVAALALTGSLRAQEQVGSSRAAPASTPASESVVAQTQTWSTFNGDLGAQKYSTADQITPDNVGKLTKAWEVHTGDVSDGSGDKPASDWSATPLFVNDTVYVVDAVLPHLRARAGHRQGQVDLRHPSRC